MIRTLLLLLIIPTVSFCQVRGKVVKIADGDTFTILVDQKQRRIRLHGIDCPERGQDFGNVAKQYLSDLIGGRDVVVRELKTDRYGRTIAIAFVDGININEALLGKGLAWHFVEYDKNPEWTKLQERARKERKGLWQGKDPVPPWEYRKRGKKVM